MEEEKQKKKRKKKETGGERKPNWKEYTATVEDIQNFLMDRIVLRHNVITKRVEYRAPLSSPEGDTIASWSIEAPSGAVGGAWQPICDRVVNSLWAELSATKMVRVQDMYRVIESDFVPDFHPFIWSACRNGTVGIISWRCRSR